MAAQHLSAVLIQKRARGMLVRLRLARHQPAVVRRASVCVSMSPMQRFVARGGGSFGDVRGFRSFTATRLQAWARAQRQRWVYALQRFPVFHIAALQIQYAWKAHCQHCALAGSQRAAPSTADGPPPRVVAALRLQAAWKRYTNRRIFRYYRDLISFRDAGDPARMLRAVNPGEAALLDAAMGAHVRFRLGGLSFPPTIYYKVFTRRPVCDLNAFSPKDYAGSRKQPVRRPARRAEGPEDAQMLIRVGGAFFRARRAASDRSDARRWYQRMEHNGWRPVTAKVMADANADPIARATGRQPASSRLQFVAPAGGRKAPEDREAARRRKKREWMRKLYAQGLLTAKAQAQRPEREDDEAQDDGSVDVDVDFDGDQWEEQAEDVLQWAAALDYDEYVGSWQALGKTASTDEY